MQQLCPRVLLLLLLLMLVLVLVLMCLLLLLLLYRLAVVLMRSRRDTVAVVELLHAVSAQMLAKVGKRSCSVKTVAMDARVATQADALWPVHRRQSRSCW